MSDSRNLYEQVILDHNRNPRNYGKPPVADTVVDGFNPLCGDSFTIYATFNNDMIETLHFEGNGCAISKASASLMTTLLAGKTPAEARELSQAFEQMLTAPADAPVDDKLPGELLAFSGIREFPMRVKCATLAWRALIGAFVQR